MVVQKKVTWEVLITLEPRLLELHDRANALRRRKRRFNALDVWYGRGRYGMKDELTALVGYRRKDIPELGTNAAYDLAYDKIYCALTGEKEEQEEEG